MAGAKHYTRNKEGKSIHRQGKDFPDGCFNPFIDMHIYVDDLTPNNLNTGAVQVPRVRIDHFYDAVGKETNPKITK